MSSLTNFGLSATGLEIPRQADFTASLQQAWVQAFGAQVNLDPRSNNGMVINIMAERFAYLAELLEVIYNASYPAGAIGVAVDNLLALQGLKRLPATATRTARSPVTQASGITLYGLVCYGDPGTVIPAGSLVSDQASPAHQFATEAAITIGPAQSAVQSVTFNTTPTSGAYALTLTTAAGTALTTPSLPYNAPSDYVEAAIVELTDANGSQPFSDVLVSQAANVLTLSFGATAPTPGEPSSANQAIPLVTVASNTLQPYVNLTVAGTVAGQPAQGVGLATATTTGPSSVTAGAIATIATPVSGWASVTNQLDCVTGSDAESDAQALARRASLVASQAQGPLASVLQRVQQVAGVTAAKAFVNASQAAQQTVTVGSATSGTFALVANGQTTAALPYNCTAAQLQAALRALPGADAASVTGAAASGLVVDWGTSFGGQAVPLMSATLNSTGAQVIVAFGRYPKSLELVVEGGSNSDVAEAIFAAAPAGLASFGQAVLTTTITTTAGSPVVTVLSSTGLQVGLGVSALGLSAGSTIQSLSGNQVTLSAPAVSAYSNVAARFGYYVPIRDSSGNLQVVNFSRPQAVTLFILVRLTTDLYLSPGDPTSGSNPTAKFSPASVPTIQANIKAVVDSYSIGDTIVATGTNGIASAFRDVPGVEDATVAFDTVNPPQNTGRLTLQVEQVADCELGNITVAYV